MEIKGWLETSFVDWDGKIVSVVFLPNCNFRCPWCYNVDLVLRPKKLKTIPFYKIEVYLKQNKEFIDGVCITGGEPCLHKDLPELCKKIKELGFLVKVDTNGSNPEALQDLIFKKLVDYVALDIKAPLDFEKYCQASGVRNEKLFAAVKKSILVLKGSGIDYEFRTTVVPGLHTAEDVKEIAHQLRGAKKYALQNFVPGRTIDPAFKDKKPFSSEEMRQFVALARRYIHNTIRRGK